MRQSQTGAEAIEGFHAFKERRSPSWVPEELGVEGRLLIRMMCPFGGPDLGLRSPKGHIIG